MGLHLPPGDFGFFSSCPTYSLFGQNEKLWPCCNFESRDIVREKITKESVSIRFWRLIAFKTWWSPIFFIRFHLRDLVTRNYIDLLWSLVIVGGVRDPQISDSEYPVAFSHFSYLEPTNPCTPLSTKHWSRNISILPIIGIHLFRQLPPHCNTTMQLKPGLQSIAEMLGCWSMKVSSLGMVGAKIKI